MKKSDLMNKILFFLPFWWDHVYSDFDPWKDSWTSDKIHYKFLWELNDKIPFDGVLFSRIKVEASKRKLIEIDKAGGIRKYLRIPSGYPIFGDCGAFGYINEKEPPFDPLETLDFYEKMQYDLACTVDHLIVKATYDDKYARQDITLKNAEKMKNKWSNGNYSFDLIGVAQGWSADSYRETVEQLLDMNFKHIALGGLVRSNTPKIIRILKECYSLWEKNNIGVHLFGVGRWSIFPFYLKYGITSFDNAYHRRAWMSGKNNYELDGKGYTAVRIPLTHPRSKERILEEQKVFDVLKSYVIGKTGSENVIKALKKYEQKVVELGIEKLNRFEKLKGLEENYLLTLQEKPWKKCDCSICKEIGIHVCIFRSNERNMRRGFHNLYQFYSRFGKWLNEEIKLESSHNEPTVVDEIPIDRLKHEHILVIAACSKTKLGIEPKIKAKAKDMYLGRLFKSTRRLSEYFKWDYLIISAKYGLLSPEQEIAGYEKFLKTKKDIKEIKPKVIPKLKKIMQQYDTILVIAGDNYREVINELVDERFIFIKSKGYGDLCSKVNKTINHQQELPMFFKGKIT